MKLPSESIQGHDDVHTHNTCWHRFHSAHFQKMKAESRSLRCQATTEAPEMVGSQSNTSEIQSSTPHTLLDGRPRSKTAIPIWARPPQSFVCFFFFFFASGNITDDGKPSLELVKNLVDLLPLQEKLSVLRNLCGFLESQSQGGVLQLRHEIDFWDIFDYNCRIWRLFPIFKQLQCGIVAVNRSWVSTWDPRKFTSLGLKYLKNFWKYFYLGISFLSSLEGSIIKRDLCLILFVKSVITQCFFLQCD